VLSVGLLPTQMAVPSPSWVMRETNVSQCDVNKRCSFNLNQLVRVVGVPTTLAAKPRCYPYPTPTCLHPHWHQHPHRRPHQQKPRRHPFSHPPVAHAWLEAAARHPCPLPQWCEQTPAHACAP